MDRTSWIVIGVAALIIVLLVGLLLLIVAGVGVYCFVLQPGACFSAGPAGAGTAAITGGSGAAAGAGTGGAAAVPKSGTSGSGTPKTAEPAEDKTPAAGEPPAEEAPAEEAQPDLKLAEGLKLGDPTYWCNGGKIMLKSIGIENTSSSRDFDYSGTIIFSLDDGRVSAEGNTNLNLKAGKDGLLNIAVIAGKMLDTGNAGSVDLKVVFESNNTYLAATKSTASAPC